MGKSEFENIKEIEEVVEGYRKLGTNEAIVEKDAFLMKCDEVYAKYIKPQEIFVYSKRLGRYSKGLFDRIIELSEQVAVENLVDSYFHFKAAAWCCSLESTVSVAERVAEAIAKKDIKRSCMENEEKIFSLFEEYKKLAANACPLLVESARESFIKLNDLVATYCDHGINLRMLENAKEIFGKGHEKIAKANMTRLCSFLSPQGIFETVRKFDFLDPKDYDEKVLTEGSAQLNLEYSKLPDADKYKHYMKILTMSANVYNGEVVEEVEKVLIENLPQTDEFAGEEIENVYAAYCIKTPWAVKQDKIDEDNALREELRDKQEAILKRLSNTNELSK